MGMEIVAIEHALTTHVSPASSASGAAAGDEAISNVVAEGMKFVGLVQEHIEAEKKEGFKNIQFAAAARIAKMKKQEAAQARYGLSEAVKNTFKTLTEVSRGFLGAYVSF